jgi:hypothetical protein
MSPDFDQLEKRPLVIRLLTALLSNLDMALSMKDFCNFLLSSSIALVTQRILKGEID